MALPNDPLFNLQWYLKNTGQAGGTAGIDINVEKVWDNYTGTGIRVGIYDDGVQVEHPDLIANYNAALQPVIGGVPHVGTPTQASDNHGTPPAGIIAASGNNNLGVVGIAYGSTFGTARFLGANNTLAQQLLDAQTNFDVTNHSWGSTRNYFNDGNGNNSWQSSANTGRGGLGVIMVKAAGNERVGDPGGSEPVGRDANDSGDNASRYAVVVGATLNTGFVAEYSSPGACLLVSAPAGPTAPGLDQLISTDRTGTNGYNNGTGTPNGQPDYANFNGTSAATPVVSGVAALILQANPTLGWRDMQEILAYSARQVGSAMGAAPTGSEADVWRFNAARDWNGGGLHFSNDYGFGMVDALTAVRLAETWRIGSPTANTSANEQNTTATVTQAPQAIPDNNGQSITYTFNITGAISIESAMLNLNLNHTAVGDLRIVLTSPGGTQSDIWKGTNAGTAINTSWSFGSREFYGDVANGTWTVTISDVGALGTGTVGDATLTLYGSTQTANDTYVYTNEFAAYAATGGRNQLTDTGGTDTLNAAALMTAMNVSLQAGIANQIAGQTMTIANGTVIENLIGGDGNDTLAGNSANNLIMGARGNDALDGGDGNDSLTGGTGNDSFVNSSGLDTITDFVAGGTDDSLNIAALAALSDFAKAQGLAAQVGADTILTLGFNNVVTLKNVTLGALTAADFTLAAAAPNNTMNGTVGPDTITGTGGVDSIIGGTGNDTLGGFNGNDTLSAGDNDDYLYGGAGDNLLEGGSGIDVMIAEAGNDTLIGGDGTDYFYAGTGNNVLSGGAGTDVFISEGANDIMNGGSDHNFFYRYGTGGAYILGGDGIDEFAGGNAASNDTFEGGGGLDYGFGGDGNDVLNGGAGNDVLIGQNGNDTIDGGAGVNLIWCNDVGNDQVRINTADAGTQVIDFFEAGGANDSVRILGSNLTSFADFQNLVTNYNTAINGNLVVNTATTGILYLNLGANQTAIWFQGIAVQSLTAADFTFG
jgi:Ca2+-binding RTX toxin-like protein